MNQPGEQTNGTITISGKQALALQAPVSSRLAAWIVLLAGIVTGLIVAIAWLPAIADDAIGMNLANTILGTNAAAVTLTGGWFTFAFAIAAGLGNTFTACNCVVFSCIAPLSRQKGETGTGILRLLMWMVAGVVAITALYGIVGALLGAQLPGLSRALLPLGHGIPVRLVQSSVVFVILGALLLYWGLVTLRFAKNPLRGTVAKHPWLIPLALGAIVGGFSVGRPYPLFHTLFIYAASSGNIFLSAALLALQGICNIAIMALIFVLLILGTGGRFENWMRSHAFGIQALTAFSVIGGGVFFLAYWGLRLPANFGLGWFPHF